MAWILIVLGVLALIMTIKGQPKTEKEAEAQAIILKHKSKFRIIGTALILIGIAMLFGGKDNKLSDEELFKAFYSDLLEKTKDFDNTANPFFISLQNGDLVSAAQIAKNVKNVLYEKKLAIEKIKTPKFKDKELSKQVSKALEYINDAYMYKISVIESYLDFAKDPSQLIIKSAELKNNAEKASQYLAQGVFILETINLKYKY